MTSSNYWTIENIKSALPNAKLYNFGDNFEPAAGVRVTYVNFDDDCIALVRLPNEQKGIPVQYLNKITPRAFITTDAKAVEQYNLPVIEVENTYKAVFAMARYKRSKFAGKVIDITGSAGKSTTTKMCHSVLEKFSAEANLNQANTNFGIAWNMTNYRQDAKYWVNETSLGGGMSLNSLLTMPNIAVITNLAPVHLKPTQPFKNVAVEKSKIFDYIKPDGVAILYKEMDFFDYVYEAASKKNCRIITFGESDDADVKIDESNNITIFGEKHLFSENPVPAHILLDAAIVSAILYVLGLPIDYENLKDFKALSGRGEVISGKFNGKDITVIDESFNANPLSMKFSLKGFNKLYGDRENKILILGDMAEGGPETEKQHFDMIEYIKQINPDKTILVGEIMPKIASELQNAIVFDNAEQLNEQLHNLIDDSCTVLVKSSHSIELYKTVNLIKKNLL